MQVFIKKNRKTESEHRSAFVCRYGPAYRKSPSAVGGGAW